MSGDSEEKSLAPSQRKLRKAREKGQIPLQRDMRIWVVTAAGLVFVGLALGRFIDFFERSMALGFAAMVDPQVGMTDIIAQAVTEGRQILGMLMAVVIGALVLTSLVVNRGFLLSFDPMTPNLSNMDPVRGFQNLFGVRAMAEFGKSLARLVAGGAAAGLVIWLTAGSLVHAPVCGLACQFDLLVVLATMVFAVVLAVALVAAILDLPLQVHLFNRNQKMTRSEMKSEQKNTHGSPEVRKAQNRVRGEVRNQKGRTGIGQATIVIFGPDRAVALRYVKAERPVPLVVARAGGPATEAFIEKARHLMVPFYREPDLARRLYATSRPGMSIGKAEFGETARAITMTNAGGRR